MMKAIKWLIVLGVVAVAAFLIGMVASPALAQGSGWSGAGGCSMTGSWTDGRGGAYGPGMMGGYPAGPFQPEGDPISMEEAEGIADRYAQSFGANLELAEVMQFERNFYAEIVEQESGIGAQEILIDLYSGAVRPEPGPNMMWNTRYGHMGRGGGMMGVAGWWGQPRGEMQVTPQDALEAAQSYLDQALPGITVGDEVTPFYGYYSLHTLRDGEIEGMLSVNGYTGQVWYHSWHGKFVAMTGEHD